MLVKREIILLKLQPDAATPAAPDPASDAMLVESLVLSNTGQRMLDRDPITQTLAPKAKIFGGTLKQVTFDAELKGAGVAGVAPEIGQALRACGLSEAIVTDTSVTYQPVSDGHEYATIYVYQDGLLTQLTGCVGTVTLNAETGSIPKLSFTFTGHDAGQSEAPLPTAAYINTVPAALVNVPFSVGGYNAIVNALTLNAGNAIVTPPSMRAADGYGKIRIESRAATGTLDPEMTLPSANDWEGQWKAGTIMDLTTGEVGAVAGNKWQIDARIQYTETSQADRDGIRTLAQTFGCVEDTGDDEWTLTFT